MLTPSFFTRAQRLDEVQQPPDNLPRMRVSDLVKLKFVKHHTASVRQAELAGSIADGDLLANRPELLRGYDESISIRVNYTSRFATGAWQSKL